ncbi:MAG TPA: hypothetical protein EYP59_06605 [Thiotrichaceae bacterium]|nr:hypothetical protein [Thiotrichaceae bacterium]
MKDKFIEIWQEAAHDLGLEIVVSFSLKLPSGKKINTDLLLRHFGDEQGMLIVRNYKKVKFWGDEISEQGYGFSVLSDSSKEEMYVKAEFIDLLIDWGWSGQDSEQPEWLKR